MKNRSVLFVLLCALVLACSRERVQPAAQQRAASAVQQDGGKVVRRLAADVVTLNPVRVANALDRYVRKYLYTPIVYLDRESQVVPGLAKSWTISQDGLTYRFVLNEKATFSDGSPVRASDVVFTLRKIVDPKVDAPQIANYLEELDLDRTRAIDEGTVEVVFRRPLASQLMHFADVFVIPERTYGHGDFNKDFNDVSVGSGPYKIASRERAKEIILERRGDYWREKPHLQTVVFKVIADHGTAWNAVKVGEIDETIISSDTWNRENANPALTRAIDFRRFYTIGYNFVALNNRRPLLADRRIRRALAMCVPIDTIVRDLYHGTARAIIGPFTPDEYAFNPAVSMVRFDPAEAKRIFASIGWLDRDGDGVLDKDGRKFTIEMMVIQGSASSLQFAQAVQAELKKVGVQLDIRAADASAFTQQLRAGNYDAGFTAWELDADPDPKSLFHSSEFPPEGQNFVFYSNAEADRLIDEARQELDLSKRKALYQQLHQVLANDQPYTLTVQVSLKWAINKRLHGVATSTGSGLFLWYPGEFDWWVEQPAAGH